MRDPYDVLGVPATASQDDIKRAYHEAAMRYHPDRNPGDRSAEARFKEIQAAYAILGDPEKRQRWDAWDRAEWADAAQGPDLAEGIELALGTAEELKDEARAVVSAMQQGTPVLGALRSRIPTMAKIATSPGGQFLMALGREAVAIFRQGTA